MVRRIDDKWYSLVWWQWLLIALSDTLCVVAAHAWRYDSPWLVRLGQMADRRASLLYIAARVQPSQEVRPL